MSMREKENFNQVRLYFYGLNSSSAIQGCNADSLQVHCHEKSINFLQPRCKFSLKKDIQIICTVLDNCDNIWGNLRFRAEISLVDTKVIYTLKKVRNEWSHKNSVLMTLIQGRKNLSRFYKETITKEIA